MTDKNREWKILTLPFNQDFNDALRQQHQAAQFIALAGKYLIPQEPDDSNTNMRYSPEKKALLGNELSNGFRLGLILTNLEIQLLNKVFDPIDIIQLEGRYRQQIFEEIQQRLKDSGVDSFKLKDKLHYEVPFHPVLYGSPFTIHNQKYFDENTYYRHNSEIVLNTIISDYKKTAPVRVWPHHFDTGTFISLEENHGKISKSIGLGWAIPDAMVDEPYFYLSYWSESNSIIPDLPRLPSGTWAIPDWNGAILTHSEIISQGSSQAQKQLIESFFKSGIEILSKLK